MQSVNSEQESSSYTSNVDQTTVDEHSSIHADFSYYEKLETTTPSFCHTRLRLKTTK